jgi:hypothetical protein
MYWLAVIAGLWCFASFSKVSNKDNRQGWCVFLYLPSRHIFGQKIELSITPNLSALYHKEIENKDVYAPACRYVCSLWKKTLEFQGLFLSTRIDQSHL